MVKIYVQEKESSGDAAAFSVVVEEDGSKTTHTVMLKDEDYNRLTGVGMSKEKLITNAFEFLLERESKESILPEFDLMKIQEYFPEFKEEVGKGE